MEERSKIAMEELSNIAMAYYQASTDGVQKLARDFFKAMDHDGDGNIDLKEFFEFLKEEGHDQMINPFFFNQLDVDQNGTLDFVEVMTLFYIIKSGRPFCDCCKMFITSTYLTCLGCLENSNAQPFYLCLDCYTKQKCDHTHNNLSRFLDNYSLLEAMTQSKFSKTRSKPSEADSVQLKSPLSYDNMSLAMVQAPYPPPPVHHHYHHHHHHQAWSQYAPSAPFQYVAPPAHNHTWNNYVYHFPQHVQQQANTMAPEAHKPQWQDWKVALQALNVALHIGAATSSGFCSIS